MPPLQEPSMKSWNLPCLFEAVEATTKALEKHNNPYSVLLDWQIWQSNVILSLDKLKEHLEASIGLPEPFEPKSIPQIPRPPSASTQQQNEQGDDAEERKACAGAIERLERAIGDILEGAYVRLHPRVVAIGAAVHVLKKAKDECESLITKGNKDMSSRRDVQSDLRTARLMHGAFHRCDTVYRELVEGRVIQCELTEDLGVRSLLGALIHPKDWLFKRQQASGAGENPEGLSLTESATADLLVQLGRVDLALGSQPDADTQAEGQDSKDGDASAQTSLRSEVIQLGKAMDHLKRVLETQGADQASPLGAATVATGIEEGTTAHSAAGDRTSSAAAGLSAEAYFRDIDQLTINAFAQDLRDEAVVSFARAMYTLEQHELSREQLRNTGSVASGGEQPPSIGSTYA